MMWYNSKQLKINPFIFPYFIKCWCRRAPLTGESPTIWYRWWRMIREWSDTFACPLLIKRQKWQNARRNWRLKGPSCNLSPFQKSYSALRSLYHILIQPDNGGTLETRPLVRAERCTNSGKRKSAYTFQRSQLPEEWTGRGKEGKLWPRDTKKIRRTESNFPPLPGNVTLLATWAI